MSPHLEHWNDGGKITLECVGSQVSDTLSMDEAFKDRTCVFRSVVEVLVEVIWLLIRFNVQKIAVIKRCAFKDCDVKKIDQCTEVLVCEMDGWMEFI